MSWLTVAPFSAARVAPALRKPCADPGQPASRHDARNQLPKLSLHHRRAALGDEEGEIARLRRRDRPRQDRQHGWVDHAVAAALLHAEGYHAVADVLPTEAHHVATA